VATLTLGGRSFAEWKAVLRRQQWLMDVRARLTPKPDPLRFVFVVAYGRSGSTLVQGLLNALPRVLVRGENNFYVLPIYQSMVLARRFRRRYHGPGSNDITSAFYGVNGVRPADFAAFARDLVVKQLLGEEARRRLDVIGFKEVRWHHIGADEEADFFDFMDLAFPGAQYVLNERDHQSVVTSGFWRRSDPGEVVHAVTRTEEIHGYLRATRPERVYDTRFEVLTGDDDAAVEKQLRGLAEFVVGTCDDAVLAAMRETLTVGHGPRPFGASRRRRRRREQTDPA
jgi:Sulfotransferase family